MALSRLPKEHRQVLVRARAVHLGEEEERSDDLWGKVRPYTDYVVAQIHQAREPGGA